MTLPPPPPAQAFGPAPVYEHGWPLAYFASELRFGLATLDVAYLRHVQRLTHPSGQPTVRHSLDLKNRLDVLKKTTGRGMALLTPEVSKRALGTKGNDGDEQTIRTVVTAVVAMYADLLNWSEDARSIHVPEEWVPAYAALADMADPAIESIRRFSAEWDETSQRAAAAARARQPYDGGTVRLSLSIDPAAQKRFDLAIDVLRAKLAARESAGS